MTSTTELVRFPNTRGERLAGALHLPPEELLRGLAVISCHGMESNKSGTKHVRLADELAARGIPVLRFDFAGCGDSEGDVAAMTYTREVEDLQAAAAWLAGRGGAQVALFGSSMGGAVAILYGARHPAAPLAVRGIATLAAVAHPGRVPSPMLSRERYDAWRRDGHLTLHDGRRVSFTLMEDAARIDVPDAARRLTCPVLVIHGTADEVVPVEDGVELHAAVPHDTKELMLVESGDHRISDPAQLDRVVAKLCDWLPRVFSG